jgi:type I restriction enzyme S subunit
MRQSGSRSGGAPPAARVRARRVATEALRGHPWSPEYWDDAASRAVAELERGPLPIRPLGERDAAGREAGFVRFTTYGAVGSRSFVSHGVRYLTPRNLIPTGIDLRRQERFVAPGGPNDPPRSRLREGDILLCNSGVASVGRVALFWGCPGDTNIAQHINLIRIDGIDPFYVAAYLQTRFARAQLRRFQSGTGAAGINFAQIRALRIPVPPAEAQAAVRRAYAAMHAAHSAAVQGAGSLPDAEVALPGGTLLQHARELLDRLIARLETYLLDPSEPFHDEPAPSG